MKWLWVGVCMLGLFFIAVIMWAYLAPVTPLSCYFNGSQIHGNITVNAVHLHQAMTFRWACP